MHDGNEEQQGAMVGKKAPFIAQADAATRQQFAMLKHEMRLHNSALFACALRALAIREGLPIDGTETSGGQSRRPPQIRQINDPPTPIASKRTP